ncbi:MAG: DUF4162 domain-containing protein [Nakamurella sp.]
MSVIILTTQYLEEADQLADRVGIISAGRIAAEGTPTELKRRVGQDLVIIRTLGSLIGQLGTVVDRLTNLDGVQRVDAQRDGRELLVATPDGGKVVGRVALTLEQLGVGIDELTLRTPTLDDVFLQITGNALQNNASPATSTKKRGQR